MTVYNFNAIEPYTYELAKFSYGHTYIQEFEFAFPSGFAGFANGDTVVTPLSQVVTVNGQPVNIYNGLPTNGIVILETEVVTSKIDSNASPTGTFNLGDTNASGVGYTGSATRFINGGLLGGANQIITDINQAQTLTNNVVTAGSGYFYPDGSTPQLVLTISAALATAATTGYIRLKVTYNCDGDV